MTGFLKGSATAMITPFTNNGVNFHVLGQLIEYQLRNGTDALVFLGTTGEPSTMTEEEKRAVTEFAVKTCKHRCKVLIGAGSNCTERAVHSARRAEELGADGILAVTPYYNKCTQNGLYEHYKALATAVKIPVVCYNVPSRTGVNLLPETMKRISEIENIAGLKDAGGNMAATLETLRAVRGKCDLFSGEDALNFPILACGGTAVISVLSNLLPREVKTLTHLISNGDYARARILSERLLPVAKACFAEVNPIPVKAGLNLLGFAVGSPRLPLTEAEEKTVNALKTALANFRAEI